MNTLITRKSLRKKIFIGITFTLFFNHAHAVEALSADQKREINSILNERSIGLTDILSHMSVGVILTRDLGSQGPRIESAEVKGGLIQVQKEIRSSIAPVLEAHVAFWDVGNHVEIGPFVAFGFNDAGADSFSGPITSAHAGFLISTSGKPRPELVDKVQSSLFFNFGGGISFTPQAKTLGDGLEIGKPLPTGVEDIYYKYEERIGWNVLFSIGYSF